MIKRDFLTARSPRQGVGIVRNNKHYNEEPRGKKRFLTVRSPRQGVGVEMRNGYNDKEPRGKKRYPHHESSSSGGRDGD